MNFNTHPNRRKLPHELPPWVKQGAKHFITVNCRPRGDNLLGKPMVAEALLDGACMYEDMRRWFVWLLMIMPDHIHIIATFNLERGIRRTVSSWKGYHAKRAGILWQPNFFEHRLRNEDEFAEKMNYVRMNPVRKGLVKSPEDWPYMLDRIRLTLRVRPTGI